MLKKKPSKKVESEQHDFVRIGVLLSAIPTNLFIQTVSKSGLPTAEARELCDLFKRLKA